MRTNGEKVEDFIGEHPFVCSTILFILVTIIAITGINWWDNNVCTIDNNPQNSSQNTSQSQVEQLPSETVQKDSNSQNETKESISESDLIDSEPLFKVVSADYYTGGRSSIYLIVIEDTQTDMQYIITSQGGICKRANNFD